jgi:hypothetical protein
MATGRQTSDVGRVSDDKNRQCRCQQRQCRMSMKCQNGSRLQRPSLVWSALPVVVVENSGTATAVSSRTCSVSATLSGDSCRSSCPRPTAGMGIEGQFQVEGRLSELYRFQQAKLGMPASLHPGSALHARLSTVTGPFSHEPSVEAKKNW